MAEEQLDADFARSNLAGKLLECLLIRIFRRSKGELVSKLPSELLFESAGEPVVHAGTVLTETECRSEFLRRRAVHPNQEAALRALAASEVVHVLRQVPPTAKVEVADAEVGPLRC